MGDKSPKSKKKNEDQKRGKADAVASAKRRVEESKRAASIPSKKK
ncbi:MAG: hypothetical protein ACLFS1_02010 [Opitutales bacterium]